MQKRRKPSTNLTLSSKAKELAVLMQHEDRQNSLTSWLEMLIGKEGKKRGLGQNGKKAA